MKNISPHELKTKLAAEQAIIVDVREPAEYRAEHIANSFSIPANQVSAAALPSQNKTVVFICRSGRRSSSVCEKFISNNPALDAYSLVGGINSWKEAGFSVITSSHKFIPLERQIQLAAGVLILAGVVSGMLVNPSFYAIAGFVGCGLTFAGLTGWCGMGKLLAVMPWNK